MHRHILSTEALIRLIKPKYNVCSKLQPNKLVQIKPSEKSLTIIKPRIVLTKVEPPYIFFP